MSRSRKQPYLKDYNPGAKQRASRAVRRQNKAYLKKLEESEYVANGNCHKRFFCSWEISDYNFYMPERPKSWRK